jgi:hypothetical protein
VGFVLIGHQQQDVRRALGRLRKRQHSTRGGG